jgi:hypothetical protein
MFQNLKKRNNRESQYEDRTNAAAYPSSGFHISPGATSAPVKGNERARLVRCQICGFPCDRERDSKQQPGSWAGLGIRYGAQQTAASSIGDRKTPAAGTVAPVPDNYYNREVVGGCPCCGSYIYWI